MFFILTNKKATGEPWGGGTLAKFIAVVGNVLWFFRIQYYHFRAFKFKSAGRSYRGRPSRRWKAQLRFERWEESHEPKPNLFKQDKAGLSCGEVR
jgi:hypothetical protein